MTFVTGQLTKKFVIWRFFFSIQNHHSYQIHKKRAVSCFVFSITVRTFKDTQAPLRVTSL